MLLKLNLLKTVNFISANLITLLGFSQLTVKSTGEIKIGSQTANPSGGKLEITGALSTLETRLFVVSPDISRYWTINSLYSYGFGIDALGVGQIYKNINAPSSIMTFNSSGNFGIGRSPSFKLDVNGTIRMNTQVLTSDSTLKRDIKPILNIASSLYQLQPYQFRRKSEFYEIGLSVEERKYNQEEVIDNRIYFGLMAQEVQKVFPNLVYADSSGVLSVDYVSFIPLMLQELKNQRNEFVLLKEEIQKNQTSSTASLQIKDERFSNKLFQNYPNPANDYTSIKCTIDLDATEANLYIYDSGGSLIEKQIINERGEAYVQLDTQNYPSGMYCYFLVIDGVPNDSKQLIVQNQ